ncbi:MAG: choice-of-anchor D domain-containing protein [Candidatus Acidiferrales bacterium]
MRSTGTCVRVAAAVVFLGVVLTTGKFSPEWPPLVLKLRASPTATGESRNPQTVSRRVDVAPGRADASLLAQPQEFHGTHFELPLMFEENDGQYAPDVRFAARVRGAVYRLTSNGIEIDAGAVNGAGRIELGFVDAGAAAVSNDGEPSDARKPRKHKRSSKGRSSKPRKRRKSADSGRAKSSHAPGTSDTRPRDDSRPSRRDGGAAGPGTATLHWDGVDELKAETNYFFGRDPSGWHTHVANFDSVRARDVMPGFDVVVRGAAGDAEYDVDVAPGIDAGRVRMKLAADGVRWSLDRNGDLVARDGHGEFRMLKPVTYEIERSAKGERRRYLASDYELEADGTVGFRVVGRNPNDELVIDPALSVTYFSFLGGTGSDSAASVAVDSSAYVYVGGTTTSPLSFGETSTTQGNPVGASVFFVAKIDPTKSGAASLLYLTFIGGSSAQLGGKIAVDGSGNVALVGTTTSYDYPVMNSGTPAMSTGDVAVTELEAPTKTDPTGGEITFSALFGGNGHEGTLSLGSVGFYQPSETGQDEEIFVAMDTTSTNLPVYPPITTNSDGSTSGGPYQPLYAGGQGAGESGGGYTDGFFVALDPTTAAQGNSTIRYCTYLGIYGHATVTGLAVDSKGNAYLSGYADNPTGTGNGSVNTTNGFQPSYGGGSDDGFVMKILPSGNGVQDLSYGTFLGGSGSDQALAIAVSSGLPGTVYVTGTTQSADFPVTSASAYQTCLGGASPCTTTNGQTSNAFLAVISQSANFATSLTYSTYLGGAVNDTGQSVYFTAANEVYVAGTTTSPLFPWLRNLQPFEGTSDAFVAEIDPTATGAAGLKFSTPLGGLVSSASSVAHGNAVAVDANGNVYVAGDTNSSDFPRTSNPANGFQQICQSCSESPALPDAFVVGVSLSPGTSLPSVAFNVAALNFGSQPNGSQEGGALYNTGDAPLTITSIGVSGVNNNDFTVQGTSTCLLASVAPGGKCTFEIGFLPSTPGTETGLLTFSDNGAGSPQVLVLNGSGGGALTANVTSLNFPGIAPDPTAPEQLIVDFTNSSTVTSVAATYATQGSNTFNVAPGSCSIIPEESTCGVSVTFTPTKAGTYTGELIASYPSSQSGTAQIVIALTGTSAAGTPSVTLVPGTVSFPPTGLGAQSVTETVTVQNTGDAAATLSGASIVGANASDFAISPGAAGGCPLGGGTIAASSSCTIAVTFNAASAGNYSATLNVSDNAQGSPQSVALTGTAVTLGATLSTSSVAFGTSTIGIATVPVNVTLTNSGSAPLTISAISISGADKADFAAPNNCPASLAAGASCTLSVSFNPTQAGNRTAVLQVFDSAPQSPQSVAVGGNAVAAQMGVSPASLNFGNQLANTASAASTLTVTNTAASPAMLAVTSAAVSGSTDFSVVKNGCSAQVATGATCTITVQFDPGTSATSPARSGTLVIQSNASGGTMNVALSGTAEDFELGPVASGGTSVSVDMGSTATFNLDLTSSGGFAGAVAVTCAGTTLPGTCTVTPASITAAANAQEAFSVTVATSASDTRRMGLFAWLFEPKGASPTGVRFLLGLILCGFLFATVRVRRIRIAACSALLLAAVVFGVAACGGGAAGDPVDPPPTSETYSLTVTATSGTATRTLPLTLTVNTD